MSTIPGGVLPRLPRFLYLIRGSGQVGVGYSCADMVVIHLILASCGVSATEGDKGSQVCGLEILRVVASRSRVIGQSCAGVWEAI